MLASQLPENPADAKLVIEAVTELLETFLAAPAADEPKKPSNVLPFAAS